MQPALDAPTAEAPVWYAQAADDVLRALDTDAQAGLATPVVQSRQQALGPNLLVRTRRVTFWRVARDEITEPMILLLLAVGVVYAFLGEPGDAVAILVIICAIVLIELAIELRAKRAVASLATLAPPQVVVVRDRAPLTITAAELVPGDIVLLRAGERVPADIQLIAAQSLAADESALTGESMPVEKQADITLPTATPLAERLNMVYAGTVLTRGSGRGVVVATAMATELGRIVGLVDAAREPKTPLQQAMKALSGRLVGIALAFSILIPLIGWIQGQPLTTMLLIGMTLAFATIPEEMPIIITMVLALGALDLARRNALVKRLRAAEALGAVTVLCTDKTGTLTHNRMTLTRLMPCLGVDAEALLRTAVQATEAEADDPTDTAILAAAQHLALPDTAPRATFPFTADTRAVTLVYPTADGALAATKGALEALLALASPGTDGAPLQQQADRLAAQGLRVLAVGEKRLTGATMPSRTMATEGLTILGLIGLSDPPRLEVAAAVAATRTAGIRVVMITGDHPRTAVAVARAVGLPDQPLLTGADLAMFDDAQWAEAARRAAIIARVQPEHKLRLVQLLQADGQVVAMTGDGINDAPALKQADIGVAMGVGGTDVAREAGSIVLTDNNFASLVAAIAEGRRLYSNLRKGTRYYLAIKFALIAASLTSVLLSLPVLFAPIQIIVLELFMDVNAALGFAVEPAEPAVMTRAPRSPQAPFVDHALATTILGAGSCLFVAVFVGYLRIVLEGAEGNVARAQTVAFLTWLLGHAVLALVLRGEEAPLRLGRLLTNRIITLWSSAVVITMALAVTLPPLQLILKTVPISATDWAWVISLGLAVGLVVDLARRLRLLLGRVRI